MPMFAKTSYWPGSYAPLGADEMARPIAADLEKPKLRAPVEPDMASPSSTPPPEAAGPAGVAFLQYRCQWPVLVWDA